MQYNLYVLNVSLLNYILPETMANLGRVSCIKR